MKKFEEKYPVAGTSALKPGDGAAPARRPDVYAFSGYGARGEASFVSALRSGSAQGMPFERISRSQAVVGGCIFAASALSCLIVSL